MSFYPHRSSFHTHFSIWDGSLPISSSLFSPPTLSSSLRSSIFPSLDGHTGFTSLFPLLPVFKPRRPTLLYTNSLAPLSPSIPIIRNTFSNYCYLTIPDPLLPRTPDFQLETFVPISSFQILNSIFGSASELSFTVAVLFSLWPSNWISTFFFHLPISHCELFLCCYIHNAQMIE